MKRFLLPFFMLSAFCFAYLPGESEFASLDGGHGIFGNPAAIPAFDSWGALTDYQFDDGISTFRIGGNLDHLAAGFSYSRDGKGFDESRWSLSHGSEWLARSIFLGTRVEALRSAAFNGTEWLFTAGAIVRPMDFVSLGYTGRNLLQGGPEEQKKIHDLGATVRLGSLFSVSYDVENFKRHRLLFELELYGTRVGFKMPLHDDTREYTLTLSTSLGGHNTAAVTFFDDYMIKRGAWGYHAAKNPRATTSAQIYRVPLDKEVGEVESDFVFLGSRTMGIHTVRNHFEHLLHDPGAGIVILDFSGYRGGVAISMEIKRYVEKLLARGSKVIAYVDDLRPSVILAALSCNRIVVEPSAHFSWRGLGGSSLYYKGLFDKLGVKVEFLRHGAYKSAVEPYTADSMSAEARANREELYNDYWSAITTAVAERFARRGVHPDDAKRAIDSLAGVPLLTAKSAVQNGFADTLLYLDQVPSYALKQFFDIDVPMARYKTWKPSDKKLFLEDWGWRRHIALLNIDGSIDGRMEKSVLDALRALPSSGAEALVLRVSSPGGSALASDKIWAAVKFVREQGIPVVASIGNMGASGGYYIACGAETIIAEPYSIVGSIGIYGGKVDASGLLDKLGLKAETVKTHKYSDAESFNRPWTDEERAALQEYMDDFYDRFVGVVSEAIGKPKAEIDSLYGGGRVFMGWKALEYGLVHKLGGIDAAIAEAKRLAGIGEGTNIEVIFVNTEKSRILPATGVSAWLDFVDGIGRTQFWAIEPQRFDFE
ncbi:MAG: signal peptide peptidase SppA [Fibrobacter sp.]|nr:signal peptide peptidase SppA [Fibrobacter sp.]